jgi:hypothetical protein
MIQIREASIKSLFLEVYFQEQKISTGTGFLAATRSGTVLLTNRHIVTGRHQTTDKPLSKMGAIPDRLVIHHNKKGKLGDKESKIEILLNEDGQPRWIEHPQLGARADFVALPLTDLTNIEIYTYDPANPGPEISIGPAEIVSVVGYPFGLSFAGKLAIWATGFVATEFLPQSINFLIDCRTRQGQSGSAVIAHRNGGLVQYADGATGIGSGPAVRFLGIYSGRVNEESDLGIVWRAEALAQLIDSIH